MRVKIVLNRILTFENKRQIVLHPPGFVRLKCKFDLFTSQKIFSCIEAFNHRTVLAQVYSLKVSIAPFILLAQGWFFQTFALRTNTSSTNHDGCAERTSCSSPATSTAAADNLIIFVSAPSAVWQMRRKLNCPADILKYVRLWPAVVQFQLIYEEARLPFSVLHFVGWGVHRIISCCCGKHWRMKIFFISLFLSIPHLNISHFCVDV